MLDKNITTLFKTNLWFKELCIDILSRQYPFSTQQINKYKDILNFGESYLMYNQNIIWDLKTINVTKDKIDWSGFYRVNGIELGLKFFRKYEKYIIFRSIYWNKNIDWSNELLDTYRDRWDWDDLMMRSIMAQPRNIQKYGEHYNWDKFSSNRHLNLTEELIDTYIDKWNWVKLSCNSRFKIDKKGIEKYKNQLCFASLSRNPSMVPFILAYPNDYDWDWNAFIQNPNVFFNDKLVQFLISKLKNSFTYLMNASDEIKTNFAKTSILKSIISTINMDKEIWFSESFKNYIPWKEFINRKPEILTNQELEDHINLEDFDKNLSYSIMRKLSKEYIRNNEEALLKFRWSLFRYGNIDDEFIVNNAIENDWFQLAFNTQFNWSIDFFVKHLDKFNSTYGLHRNDKIFDVFFGKSTDEDIENLLKTY